VFINMGHIKRGLAAGIAIVAAGFPAVANAMPDEGQPIGNSAPSTALSSLPSNFHTDVTSGGYFTKQPSPSYSSVTSTSSGFQWDDAGIGAAGAILLVAAGAGASASMRRRRIHRIVIG
jgi:hypothetical protein